MPELPQLIVMVLLKYLSEGQAVRTEHTSEGVAAVESSSAGAEDEEPKAQSRGDVESYYAGLDSIVGVAEPLPPVQWPWPSWPKALPIAASWPELVSWPELALSSPPAASTSSEWKAPAATFAARGRKAGGRRGGRWFR